MVWRRFSIIYLIFSLLIQPYKIWPVDGQIIEFVNDSSYNVQEIRRQLQKAMARLFGVNLAASSAIFLWKPSARVVEASNWLGDLPACEGDRMRMDPEKIFVAYLDDKLSVATLELPNDGLMYFGDGADIGTKGDWQCSKRESAEGLSIYDYLILSANLGVKYSFFQPTDANEPNFYDSKNWQIFDILTKDGEYVLTERSRVRLDAEMVPGDMDYVIMQNISRIYLDDPINVAGFELDGTALSGDRLLAVLLTVEGLLRIRLGHRLATVHVVDSVDFTWPNGDLAGVGVRRAETPANFYEPYLSSACARVRCLPVEALPCEAPIRPTGHCCDACGALATFRQNAAPSLAAARAAETSLTDRRVGISLARVDRGDFVPLYQLAVVSMAGAPYDESYCSAALDDALARIDKAAAGGSLRRLYLRVVYASERGKIHWVKVLRYVVLALPLMLLAAWAFVQQYRRSARLRLWLRDRWCAGSLDGLAVTWRRAREFVELRPLPTNRPHTVFPNAVFCNAVYDEYVVGEKMTAERPERDPSNDDADYGAVSDENQETTVKSLEIYQIDSN